MTLARLMIAFTGTELPPSAARRINERGVAGVTLFYAHNIADPPQIRGLTDAIQEARPAGAPPLLVAADQEGGQLIGLGGGTTQFAGPMALGATGDVELAERVAGAMARELRALGVNVDYAPVCDVANNPANPALGIRSFGDRSGKLSWIDIFPKSESALAPIVCVRTPKIQGVAGDHQPTHRFRTATHFRTAPCPLQDSRI